jgi:hypothetical protein
MEADPRAEPSLRRLDPEDLALLLREDDRLDDAPDAALAEVDLARFARVEHELIDGLLELVGRNGVALVVEDERAVLLRHPGPAEDQAAVGVHLRDLEGALDVVHAGEDDP